MYKCNKKNREYQGSWGNWADFFEGRDDGNGRWGGTWGILSKPSRKILLKVMRAGDLILAFQSDQGAAVGLCQVTALADEEGHRSIILKALLHFDSPVKLHELKAVDPALKDVTALQGGFPGTLYPISKHETVILSPHLPHEAHEILSDYGLLDLPDIVTPIPMEASTVPSRLVPPPKTQEANDLAQPPADRVLTTTYRILRDTELVRRIKAMHHFECQLCGHTIPLQDGSLYAEGHHIQPLGTPHNGPDVIGNVICVCPNHHAELDLGASEILLFALRQVDGHAIDTRYLDYHNRQIYKSAPVPCFRGAPTS